MFRKKHVDINKASADKSADAGAGKVGAARSDAPELDRETRIADMNIDGMPWHLKSFNDRFKKGGRRNSQSGGSAKVADIGDRNNPPLSGRETWGLILNAVIAALVIGAVFMGAVFLFILFCIYIWFR